MKGLAAARRRAGLNQYELADAAGTSQPHVSQIEAGKATPSYALARRLAAALGVTVNDLDAEPGVTVEIEEGAA